MDSQSYQSFTELDVLKKTRALSETLNHLMDAFDCNYISHGHLKNYKKEINGA